MGSEMCIRDSTHFSQVILVIGDWLSMFKKVCHAEDAEFAENRLLEIAIETTTAIATENTHS